MNTNGGDKPAVRVFFLIPTFSCYWSAVAADCSLQVLDCCVAAERSLAPVAARVAPAGRSPALEAAHEAPGPELAEH